MDGVNENVIEWLKNEKTASVTAANATRLKGRLLKLAKEFPEEVQIIAQNEDGSIFAHVPVRYIKGGAPRKVEMSDEQKAELAERFRLAREKIKAEEDEKFAEFADCMNTTE